MMGDLATKALSYAKSQVGVREHGGNNRGQEVEQYLAYCSRPPGDSWCASLVSWCVGQAASELGVTPMFKRSAGALRLLEKNPDLVIEQPEPGCIGVIDEGHGKGHAFFVVEVVGDHLVTIEGNSLPDRDPNAKTREGGGVWLKRCRTAGDCCGFLKVM